METFTTGNKVTWSDNNFPGLTEELKRQFGEGPFRVVGTREVSLESQKGSGHPQQVEIEISENHRQTFSGAHLMKVNKGGQHFLDQCEKNLECGRAIATGIGMFAALIKLDEKVQGSPRSPQILLRRREENNSLLGADLSGKWEMIGGGVEIAHFQGNPVPYQVAVLAVLTQELKEEAGLSLATALPPYSFLIPAWYFGEDKGIIDLAFVMPISWKYATETDDSREKFRKGDIRFFRPDELDKIEIISPRTRFLIKKALDYVVYLR
jgi:8-oxo-dGTP pyrophosphatase MutT (NUDIX family)